MVNFTNEEQLTIMAVIDATIEDLAEALEYGTKHWKSSYERLAEQEIYRLQSIREKINEERKRQGRIEL